MRIVTNNIIVDKYVTRYQDKNNGAAINHLKHVEIDNPYASPREHEKFLSGAPFDFNISTHYIKSLIKIRELDKAEQELNYLIDAVERAPIDEDDESLKKALFGIFLCKLHLFCYQNRISEALALIENNKEYFDSLAKKDDILYFLKKKSGIYVTPKGYTANQIENYLEGKFLSPATEKQKIQRDDPNYFKASFFFPEFPLEKVFNKVKELIEDSDEFYLGYIGTTYIFRCESCGMSKGKKVDFFRVVVINGTQNIIEMEPTDGYRYIPVYYDLTDFVKDGEVIKKTSK